MTSSFFSQIGNDINGEAANDNSGFSVSLSADGSVVAIGSPWNDVNGDRSGHIRIYKNINNTWTQIGSDINGEAAYDELGYSVSLSADGNVVAVGAHQNLTGRGYVSIYINVNGTWTKVGSDIEGEEVNDNSGRSVSLSADGNVVAIGALLNEASGSTNGHVRIYKNINNTWIQIGSDIDGEDANSFSGRSVSLSADGNIVAIGADWNDGNGTDSGHVRIYENVDNIWTQIGSDIDGEAAGDRSGWAVSLSADGSLVAIGAIYNDDNGTNSGHVRIYENVDNIWTQVGSDIDGEAAGDSSGVSVSLSSDGSIVAIGSYLNDGNGTDSGHVRIYKNINNTWTKVGSDLDGEAAGDSSGVSVSLSSDGSLIAVGAPNSSGNGPYSGTVQIYQTLDAVDDGDANFSIRGTVEVGNTLSINEDTADPDGTGTLSYSWQTSSDDSIWTVVETNSTYVVGANEEGKSIRAVISYADTEGFNETVNTSTSIIPLVDDGDASFYISGTVAVGNTLSINEDTADPDGTGTLSYSWQTSNDDSNWIVLETNSTYTVGANDEGKSIRAVLSYTDAQGFDETVITDNYFVSPSQRKTTISNAIYDEDWLNLITPIYQDYIDGQSKIPFYIHPGGDAQYVGVTDALESKLENTIDSSFYKDFIVNIFNRIDNLIDVDFELWDHYNGSLIDIYATEYNPYESTIGAAYAFEQYIDVEFKVLDDVRENYITIVHEIGHALGLEHPNGDGFNSNYDIQDTIMSYNGNSSLEDIWFSDADIYTLQRIFGVEENTNGNASFSIRGTVKVGNTLTINEDTADPDGTGTLSYSWQTSSDDSIWTVVGTNSTYIVGADDEGKSIKAVISYVDAEGFNETISTSASSITLEDNGDASFSISGTVAVGNTLSINEDTADPDGTGTLSYSWQTSNDDSNWIVVGNNSTYTVGANDEGKSIRAVLSYTDAQGFNETVTTTKALSDLEALNYVASNSDLISSIGIDIEAAKSHYRNFGESQGLSLDSFNAADYLAKYSDLSPYLGDDQTLALKHYILHGYREGRTDTLVDSTAPIAPTSLTATTTSTNDNTPAITGIAEAGSTVTLYNGSISDNKTITYNVSVETKTAEHNSFGSGSSLGYKINNNFAPHLSLTPGSTYIFDQSDSSNLNHPLLFYLDSNKTNSYSENIISIGIPGTSGSYTQIQITSTTPETLYYQCSNHGLMGDSLTTNLGTATADNNGVFSITSSALSDGTYLLTTTATDAAGNVSVSSSPLNITISNTSSLTDFQALNYIASNSDLISSIGIDIDAAKSHYTNYGESQGLSLDSFNAADYLAKYSDLSPYLGDDQTLALKHYILHGYAEGRTDTLMDSGSGSETVTYPDDSSDSSTDSSPDTPTDSGSGSDSNSDSGSGSGSSSNLTDFEALNYIASHVDLLNYFGTDDDDIESAKSHYENHGKAEGRTLDNFDEWGYLASNNELINTLGSNTTEAVKHYISFGYSQGKLTTSFDAQSYLNNHADLRNYIGDNQELATQHYVKFGFNEGRVF